MVLSAIMVTLVINYLTIIPLIPLIVLFIYFRKYFISTSIELRRIDGISNLIS